MSDSISRRGFLKDGGLGALALALGVEIRFAEWIPEGLVPLAYADEGEAFVLQGKDGLKVLGDRPVNAETPPHLLDDEVTPTSRLFVRNNGLVPDLARDGTADGWTLTVDGEVEKKLVLTLDELKAKFRHHTLHLVLECAGNGRSGFFPPVAGNQWTYGAVGCPLWTGVRLKDVLRAAGLKRTAVYTGYYGHDRHLSEDPEKVVISRGTPIAKALDDHTLLAFAMNGAPLTAAHGFPLRLVVPGYPASASGKWLKRIWIRDRVHDGAKMTGMSYRMPGHPVSPGTVVDPSQMEIIETMPVKSLVTYPRSGLTVGEREGRALAVRGFAWSGAGKVSRVDVSFDFGRRWRQARLKPARNRYGWQRWETTLDLPGKGYYEIWARAQDRTGEMQPMVVPGWNPEGYLNNAMPRISVTVGA